MKINNNQNSAVVLGMFETGLGVARSLGRNGIKVYGFDFKKDIGFYSKYVAARLCPHPLNSQSVFLTFLINFAKEQPSKPVLFVTADDFLISVAKNKEMLEKYFLINLPDFDFIQSISDKYLQYQLAKQADIPVPETFFPTAMAEVESLKSQINYPVFIKAKEVNSWRKQVSSTIKGFVVHNPVDLVEKFEMLLSQKVPSIVQEIIEGDDTHHFKMCAYISPGGEMLGTFTLQKIRQNPIHFGVGAVVESCEYPELMEIGKKLFKNINYRGVGSAEFKLDTKDQTLKLIELNPRYWQQNALADKCGVNFPLIHYRDLTGQTPMQNGKFESGVKWVNIWMDFESFLEYRKEGSLGFGSWAKSLRGKKMFSDFAGDDLIPGFYELDFGKRLFNLPCYLFRKLK